MFINCPRVLRAIVVIILLYATTMPAFAGIFYVRPDGNDSNPGTDNTPSGAWETIQKAADTLKAGDTAEIQPGTYNETVTITNSGTAEQYIVFHANGEVIVSAEGPAVKLDGANYVRVEGLTCKSATASGISLISANNNILVRNVSSSADGKGIEADPASADNQVIGNIASANISSDFAGNIAATAQATGHNPGLQEYPAGHFIVDDYGRKTIDFAPDELIVKFKKGLAIRRTISSDKIAVTGLPSIDTLHKKLKVTSMDKIFKGRPKALKKAKAHIRTALLPDLNNIYKLKIGKETNVFKAIAMYRQDPNVEYAEPNYVIKTCNTYPNDVSFGVQWSLNNTGQTSGTPDADIDAPEAWDISTGSNVVVAVVDTGVDYTHQDLAGNIWSNPDEIPDNGVDDDGNGLIDDVKGWDFYNADKDPKDDNGHGSHVSGIASAATNNATGIAGVSWNSRIMAVKVLSNAGRGYDSDVANGIIYAADNGADVINLSLGGNEYSTILKDAVDYAFSKNCVIVAAAGNSGDDTPLYPAAYDNVLSVAATDHNDARASFSTFGQEVDIAAPGVNIYSSVLNNGYNSYDGTSMATPHVTGIVALILAQNPSLANYEVIKKVYICADDLGAAGWDKYTGFGRVNAFKALNSDSQSYLFARIRGPKEEGLFSKNITITGTAAGNNFDRYEIWAGQGQNPANWQATGITLTGGQVIDGVLATWDCSGLPSDFWTIKLISYDKNSSTRESRIYLSIDNSYQQGWPQKTMYGGASYNASIIAGDVDNDGKLEVVTGSYEGNIYIWRYDGTLLPGWPVYIGQQALTPALADLDGDGDLEIIIGTNVANQDEKLFVLHHDGTLFAGNWPKGWAGYGYEINYISDAPVAADIDGDGDLEILIGGEDWKVHAWHHDGTKVTGWPVSLSNNQNATAVAVGDIDGDGNVEIVAAESTTYGTEVYGSIYAWHHDGTPVAGWPIDIDGTLYQPVLGDINGDGKLEVIVSSRTGLFVFNGAGAVLVSKNIGTNICKMPCLGDLDNDKMPEIILLGSNDTIYAWRGDGSNVPGWPRTFGFNNPAWLSGAAVADVDGDGNNEVITAAYDSYFSRSYLYVFNHDGTFAAGYPKQTDVDYFSVPVIADLDKDGDVEIIAHGRYLGTIGTNVYVWDLPAPYDESKADWPMVGRNAQHMACYPIARGGISGKVALQSRNNHSDVITFELRNPGQTNLLATYQLLTATDGSYTLNDIKPGTYDLTAKGSIFLKAKQADVIVQQGRVTPNINFNLLGGDCDNNNVVSGVDFAILRAAYGTKPGDAKWDTRSDFNGNNQIDGTDFSILKSNYGISGAQ